MHTLIKVNGDYYIISCGYNIPNTITDKPRIDASIMIWEIFTVFVPIYEVIRLQILSLDPDPLQEFSALGDFSGENIAFSLCCVESILHPEP